MTPRRRTPLNSLELLLDPICNTFGCVIFITMLASLLVQNSSQRLQKLVKNFVSPSQASQLRSKWKEVHLRYEQLQKDRDRLEQLVSPEAVEWAKQVQQLELDRQNLQNQKEHLQQQLSQTQQKIQNIHRQKEQLQNQLQKSQQELTHLEKELEEKIHERTQTLRFPRERLSGKNSVALQLRFGRLYVWHRYDSLGRRLGLNTEEYVVIEETAQDILTAPKPYAGIPLDDPSAEQQIAARLRPFPPERWFLDFAIFDDSFDHFQKLKKIIVKLGYEYRLILVVKGQRIYDRGGGRPIVQ
jgi:hypothetical protein